MNITMTIHHIELTHSGYDFTCEVHLFDGNITVEKLHPVKKINLPTNQMRDLREAVKQKVRGEFKSKTI